MIRRGKRTEATAGIWRPRRIRNKILNTTYKGVHEYGKRSLKKREIIIREVPPIVSEEIWDKAHQVLKDNRLEVTRNTVQKNLLRGLIKCGVCDLNNINTCYKDPVTKKATYYKRIGKTAYRRPTLGKCSSKSVPKEWIEDLVWNDVVSFIYYPDDAIVELGAAMETRRSKRGDLEAEWSLLLQSAQDKNFEKQSILDLFHRQLITASDFEQNH